MRWTVRIEGGLRRVNHAAALIGDYIYSFGGYCLDGNYALYDTIDVHMLNTNTLRWTLIPTKKDAYGQPLTYPDIPFQRYGHTAVAHKDKIYLWGGRNDDDSCNTLYCFDTKTYKWSRPRVVGAKPETRDGHSACVINNCMYIFGGFEDESDRFSCDVHCLNFDTMEWQYILTFGKPPSFRDFHSSCILNNRMYIFAGRGDKHSPHHSEDEIYCPDIVFLDLKTKVWHRPNTTGKVPVGRRSHSMVVYNGLLYVFGGYNGLLNEHFNDLYSFDPKLNLWNLVKPFGKPPCARRRQICLVKENKMFLFGGTSPCNIPIRTEDNQQLIDHNDTHILDFDPSLKTLAMLVVIDNRLDIKNLPYELRWEIRTLTTPNSISRQNQHAG